MASSEHVDLRCVECDAFYRRGPNALRFKTCLCPQNEAYFWVEGVGRYEPENAP